MRMPQTTKGPACTSLVLLNTFLLPMIWWHWK
uniref:Uncharacterized protein n=1 Tax=Arundo donax TaxID=35708 RepID=A0A0A9DZI8_ARUDO